MSGSKKDLSNIDFKKGMIRMEEEIKLKTIEYVNEINEIVQLYERVMKFINREKQRDLDIQTMQSELMPLLNTLKEILVKSLKVVTKKNEKDDLSKSIEYIETLIQKVNQFANDEVNIGQVLLHLEQFKRYIREYK